MPPPKNNNKPKLKDEIVDYNSIKFGIRIPESQNGDSLFMKNPQSSATGLYGQKYSELKKLPEYKDISRDEFAKDTVLQNKVFDDRFNGKLKDIPGLKKTGEDLYNEYKKSTKYNATQIAAISNLLGRYGTKKYLGYVERDGKTLEEVFPNRYGDKIKVKNKTPDEYLEESKLIKKPIVKPAKPINKSVQPINKPIKPSNKKLEDNDSWLENIVEIVDPTGITSYDDVYRSYKNTGLSGETALEALGALPLVGKIGKLAEGYKYLAKTPRQAASINKFNNAMQLGAISGKVSDAYQAAIGSKDSSGLKRTDDGVQYNGRNIMPDVANENMYKFGGNIYANGGSSIEAKRDATLVVGNQPKPSFKENKKNPVKDISEDILPLPGFRDKPEDTELIKLIKERQIKPRGPKQPYELASGAVTPTASPIDAAVVGAAGIPQLVGRGVAGALPYLDAPLTVGSKVLPSVTANNLLNAAQAAYSGEQIINPESDLRTNPNAENILMTGLGLVGLPYKAAGMKGFNKPIKTPSVSNVDKIDNTDEFKNAIEKQLDEQLDELDKEIYKFFEEQKKLDALPETKNKESLSVLEDFKTRIQTPEGKKRIKELGIDNDELLQKIKIVEDPNTFGYYAPIKNKIVLNPYFPLPKKVTRHEIEHAVQHAFQTPKTTKIDDLLSGLELKKQGTPNKQWDYSKIVNDSPVDISQYKSLISNKLNATDYFLTGSEGKEKSAFLSEIQQYMMDQGILPKTSYAEVTPEMVKNTFVDAMFDETGGGKYLRLFNIMKPTEANYKLISEGLNKMLGLTPYLGTGYLGYEGLQGQEKASQKQEYKYGGNIPMKLNKYNYGKNMYFPYGGASILTQSNLKTGEAQAKENTVLDKDKKTRDTKPVISNPSLYSGKQKQVDTASTISNIGSDISKEVNKYTYKPISTTPINYNSQIDLKIDNKTNTFSESLAPEIKTNIEAPKVDTYQMSTETDLPAPGPTVTSEQLGQGPAGKTSSFDSKAASNAGGSTATALNIGNQIYNATKNVDDRYNQDLAGNEKYNKEYSQAQEKYKEDQSIVDTTATTLGTIGTVMSAIPVVNAFSWIPALLAAGTKAIGDPIVDADYENNAREASLRNFNMASPEEYNRSMKVSNKNILAPESNQARYGGKMFSYGGNIYANGGMTMYNMPKGLTHEQHPYGGYPIGNNNYVESDEVVLDKPDGSKYIFSNRIKYKR